MVPVGPSAVHSSLAASLPLNTGGGIASSVSIVLEDGTGFSCASSLGTRSESPPPTLGLLETSAPSNSPALDPSLTDATAAGVALPPEPPAVSSGAGAAASPF